MKNVIDQFMWAYQPHFRQSLEIFANHAFEHAGVRTTAVALLVGVREPEGLSHPVCVEPENGQCSVALFDELERRIQKLIAEDPRQRTMYGDEASNRDKPIWIRQTAITRAIRERLDEFDRQNEVRSFVGGATLIDGYRVVPILQIPLRAIEAQPSLQKRTRRQYTMHTSFLDALVTVILDQAASEMKGPEPGRSLASTFSRDLDDVLRETGRKLMHVPGVEASLLEFAGLFEGCNRVSALRYEGSVGVGRMVVAAPGHDCVHVDLQLERPVPLREANWARKILQMGSQEVSLVCDSSSIYGLGRLCDAYESTREDAFFIDFVGHYTWELRHGSTVLMRTAYGVPRLPAARLAEGDLRTLLRRIFPAVVPTDAERIISVVQVAIEQKHGTLIVVSDDAPGEAKRLAAQGTPIKPTILSASMVRRVTGIDGAVLVDLGGTCHAIGVILDGNAIADGDPARGARFNSAKRYVASTKPKTMAVVVSEDGQINVFPALRPQVRRSEVEHHVAALHRLADKAEGDWHKHRNWLDEHRFYLNADQCRQVHEDLETLRVEVMKEVGVPWIIIKPFTPHSDMNNSYFLEEE